MAFRVVVGGAIAELLRFLALRVDSAANPDLRRLLDEMYRLKYLRFGTSGYRGVWNRDFTEEKTRIITQAICDYLKLQNMPQYAKGVGEDLSGRVVVIGYDGPPNSPLVPNFFPETSLATAFPFYYSS